MRKLLYALLACLCACQAEYSVTPNPKWYYSTGPAETISSLQHRDAFATYVVTTDAPKLTINASTNLEPTFAALGQITAYVDGVVWRTFQLHQAAETFTLRLDSVAGPHEVAIVEGTQIRAHELGPVGFTSITSVGVPEGYRLDSVSTPYSAGLVVWGDSRTVGGGCSLPAQQAWPVRLRRLLPKTEIFTPGYGSLTLGVHIDTPAHRAEVVQDIVQRLKPYRTQTIWFEAGVNDFLTSAFTPTQITAYYQALLPALHAALPKAKIYLQTDVVAANEATNKAGFSLPQYREGEAAGAAGLPYVQVADGRQLGTAADLSPDGVHLGAAGDSNFAARAAKLL